ncbi:MAG: hypothetical protein WBY94_08675, partial [Polyangiaceae bacterium]
LINREGGESIVAGKYEFFEDRRGDGRPMGTLDEVQRSGVKGRTSARQQNGESPAPRPARARGGSEHHLR